MWHYLELPGGGAAVLTAVGIDTPLEPWRLVLEIVRLLHGGQLDEAGERNGLLRLTRYLETVAEFRRLLRAAQSGDGTLTLEVATRKATRERLKDLLDYVGMELRERRGTYLVEAKTNEESVGRRALLGQAGVVLDDLPARLNRGEALNVEIPTEHAPLPLGHEIWNRLVFERDVSPFGLLHAIVSDRRAAMLYQGLASLDEETLRFLARRGELVSRIYHDHATVFATFGRSLHIMRERLLAPGGDDAGWLWEDLVDEKLSNPERFVRKLLKRDEGRLAYFYDTLAHLKPANIQFALSLSVTDPVLRRERFRELYAVFASADRTSRNLTESPFLRPPLDPAFLLAHVRVSTSGELVSPSWRLLWEQAFGGDDLPDDPGRRLRNLDKRGTVDAAWLAEWICVDSLALRRDRFETFLFGQRVFYKASKENLPEVLTALRGFVRYRTLMLTLERMGLSDPALYAAAARHADRLATIGNPDVQRLSLTLFQGALALVERARFAAAIDPAKAAWLTSSLIELSVSPDGRYLGHVATWIDRTLLPAFAAPLAVDQSASDPEEIVLAALAGARLTSDGDMNRDTGVDWEGVRYRVDVGRAELVRLRGVRQRQSGYKLGVVLTFSRILGSLTSGLASPRAVRELSESLTALKSSLSAAPIGTADRSAPDIVRAIEKGLKDLARIKKPKDLKKTVKVGQGLAPHLDALCADVLTALAYATALGAPEGTPALDPSVANRHNLGLDAKDDESRTRSPWLLATEESGSGVPWHLRGSLLGLDVALAPLTLRRIGIDRPPSLTKFSTNETESLAQAVALMRPVGFSDQDRDRIADALQAGRARVAKASANVSALSALADEVWMAEWHRSLFPWVTGNLPGRQSELFSLTELFWLGGADAASSQALQSWGMSQAASTGCFCLAFPHPLERAAMAGRMPLPFLSTAVPDLKLRVVETLATLRMPAVLARGVLAAAVQDLIEEARPLHGEDLTTVVRRAAVVPRERIEDYIGLLTASGPLVPVDSRPDPVRR